MNQEYWHSLAEYSAQGLTTEVGQAAFWSSREEITSKPMQVAGRIDFP